MARGSGAKGGIVIETAWRSGGAAAKSSRKAAKAANIMKKRHEIMA